MAAAGRTYPAEGCYSLLSLVHGSGIRR